MRVSVCIAFCFISSLCEAQKINWKDDFLELHITRCFPSKDVSAMCDEPSPDGEGGLVSVFEIKAKNGAGKFVYTDYRAIGASFCRTEVKAIHRLMKKTRFVCITGEGEQNFSSDEVTSRWVALETHKGQIRR